MSMNSIFKKYNLAPNESETIGFGDRFILVKHIEKGWYINVVDDDNDKLAEDGEFFHTGTSSAIIFSPALQEKPLVFKSNQLAILPGQSLSFFVKVPLVLQVFYSRKKEENLLKEIPFGNLSNTWFGDADKGEAAYSIGTEYFLTLADANPSVFEAVCPVKVHNNSKAVLALERLILRVNNLSIYKNADNFLTDLIKIEYKGKEQISSVSYSYSKTIHGEKEVVITKPREENSLASLKINFHFIKNIYRSI